MKIRLLGVDMFPADGQTDMTKKIDFRNLANVQNRCYTRTQINILFNCTYLEIKITVHTEKTRQDLYVQGSSNMTGTILCVNKSQFVPVISEPPCITA